MNIRRFLEYNSLIFFGASSIVLIGLDNTQFGWPLLALTAASSLFTTYCFRKHFILLAACLAILGISPIQTSTDFPIAFYMGLGLIAVVALPYIFTKYIYKSGLIRFPSLKEKAWHKSRLLYLLLTAILCYLILPFMLRDTGSYVNWHVEPGFWNLLEAYIGLNAVGIWDELFFVCTVLAILRKFFPFFLANIFQAFLFTSFLHTLAFEGWSIFIIFTFALIQGYIFLKTKSLLYILAIHLTVDLFLHLAIIYLNHPDLFPYFIT